MTTNIKQPATRPVSEGRRPPPPPGSCWLASRVAPELYPAVLFPSPLVTLYALLLLVKDTGNKNRTQLLARLLHLRACSVANYSQEKFPISRAMTRLDFESHGSATVIRYSSLGQQLGTELRCCNRPCQDDKLDTRDHRYLTLNFSSERRSIVVMRRFDGNEGIKGCLRRII